MTCADVEKKELRRGGHCDLQDRRGDQKDKRVENSLDPDEGPDGSAGVDTEYVDDPQIGFLSA